MRNRSVAAGTGNWKKFTSIVISSEPGARWEEVEGTTIVRTPLDLIVLLEQGNIVSEVVLAGTYAENTQLLSFLEELYPKLPIAFEPKPRAAKRSATLDDACLWLG